MTKVLGFFNRPRNMYFSILVMLTVVTGLVSISFSYYIDESTNSNIIEVSRVDNRLYSEDMVNGYVTISANESRTLNIYIMSNNNFDSNFKLYYRAEDNVIVNSSKSINNLISAHDVQQYEIVIKNNEAKEVKVYLGIANGYVGKNIEINGKEIN